MATAQLTLLNRIRSRSRFGWIGIDIGSHSVKLAQLEMVDGRKRLADAVVIPVPESAECSVPSLRTGWLEQAIRQELTHRRRFRGRDVACSLSMTAMEFRSMNIPPGSDKERREMISQELSDGGGSMSGVEFDYWDGFASSADPNNTEVPVNVLSVSEGLATEVAESIQSAGLDCQLLDGGPFILGRTVELMAVNAIPSGTFAVLDWGHRAAHLAVVQDGTPVFSRLLKDCGVAGLTNSVKQGLGLSTDDAHELLSGSGFSNPDTEQATPTELEQLVDDFAGDHCRELVRQLQKTFGYLRSQRADLVPESLYLLGGGATIRNAAAKLGHETGMPVTPWQPLKETGNTKLNGQPLELVAQAAALSALGWRS